MAEIWQSIRETVWDSWNIYDKCEICHKPLVSQGNLFKMRAIYIGALGAAGAATLPLLGGY